MIFLVFGRRSLTKIRYRVRCKFDGAHLGIRPHANLSVSLAADHSAREDRGLA